MTLKPLAALLLLVVTGAKADGPVVPWPAQVGEPAVTLANGVTLELLGIADGTSPRRNGGRRTERRSRRRRRASGRASRDVTPMAQWNFALRVTSLAQDDASKVRPAVVPYSMRHNGSFGGYSHGLVRAVEVGPTGAWVRVTGIHAYTLEAFKDETSADLEFTVAAGPWRPLAAIDVNGRSVRTSPPPSIRFTPWLTWSTPAEREGAAVVSVAHARPGDEMRVIAFDVDGKPHRFGSIPFNRQSHRGTAPAAWSTACSRVCRSRASCGSSCSTAPTWRRGFRTCRCARTRGRSREWRSLASPHGVPLRRPSGKSSARLPSTPPRSKRPSTRSSARAR